MRYGIFSDIHANLEALEAVVEAYKSESIDRYLCLGDVVGYAANPKECVEITKALCMITIAGNHDWATVNLSSTECYNPFALEAVVWTQRHIDDSERCFLKSLKLIYKNEHMTLVHGTLDEPQDFNYMFGGNTAGQTFRLLETNICFLSHTHVAGMFIKDSEGQMYYREDDSLTIKDEHKYIINVGSVGQPRDGNPHAALCIYDTDKREVCIRRIDYDIQTARKKIIDGGLPRFLGDRLTVGR